jgi:hypothetical protein
MDSLRSIQSSQLHAQSGAMSVLNAFGNTEFKETL